MQKNVTVVPYASVERCVWEEIVAAAGVCVRVVMALLSLASAETGPRADAAAANAPSVVS